MKRLLIANVNLEVGGIEKTLISLLKNIDYSNYQIDLLLLKTNGDYRKDVPKNVNVITPYKSHLMEKICNSNNIINKIIKHLLFNRFTAKLWRNKKVYDVAISFSGYYPFTDYYIINSNAKKRYIWVHTDLSTFDNKKVYKFRFKFTKNKYKYFDKIVCVSESIQKSFNKLLPKYSNKTTYLWNLIDVNTKNGDFPKLYGNYKILSVGRLVPAKRFDKLIIVNKMLKDNNIDVKTYIVGDGDEKESLQALVDVLELNDRVIFLGKQLNVIDIMKQADLFTLTSDYEGLGMVLFESLYAGLPFVATNISGIKDVAKNIAPKGSYLLSENNVEDIYQKIKLAKEGKINKNFKFDIDSYNKNQIKKFYDLIK